MVPDVVDERIIANTDFEEFAKCILNEKEMYGKEIERQNKARALAIKTNNETWALAKKIKDGRRNLGKSIMSIYYFLRIKWGLPPRCLTLREFKITEIHLREIALENSKVSSLKDLLCFRERRLWKYYLTFGYFHSSRTPFGKWETRHPLFETYYEVHGYDTNELLPYDPDNLDSAQAHETYPLSAPPNFKALLDELWEERKDDYLKRSSNSTAVRILE